MAVVRFPLLQPGAIWLLFVESAFVVRVGPVTYQDLMFWETCVCALLGEAVSSLSGVKW